MSHPGYNKSVLLAFLTVIAALIANSALTYVNLRNLNRNNELVAQQHHNIGELRLLLKLLVDAETGQRGYLITGDPAYQAPYQASSLSLQKKLGEVEDLIAVNPERKKLFDQLAKTIAMRMETIKESIRLRDEQGLEAARDYILEGKGRRLMEEIRTDIEHLESQERLDLAQRSRESATSYWTALGTGLVTSVLALALAVVGFVVVSRDLEKRQQLSEALQKSNERLEERVHARTMEIEASNNALRDEISVRVKAEQVAMLAAQELQRSNRELEQFASVASHDLQEPLRKIQAFGDRLNSLCGAQLGERGGDYLQRILSSAGRMRKLIDDLLTYSRVSSRAQPFSAVDLNEVVEGVVSDLEARLQDVDGKLEIGKLPHLEAEPSQMRQLFQNLIGNGLKFHRAGVAPVVRINSQNIVPPATGNGDGHPGMYCEIVVQDNGIGFEQEYADRIFELFQRLHGRDEYQGTGMGLAICRKIVERHGGVIAAFGTPGEGSRFVITLPIQQQKVNAAV
jgi:signal transduction histidine kinase